MSNRIHSTADLTKNQSLVMRVLSKSGVPLSAYTILDQLRDQGIRAPLQVYRALEKLEQFGLVHKLESLNAFVACSHPGCESHETTTFMICETCSKVSEITDDTLINYVVDLANDARFALTKMTIELRGTCHACQAS